MVCDKLVTFDVGERTLKCKSDRGVEEFVRDLKSFFFFKQKTAYEIGTGDWSSDVCSSDLTVLCEQYEYTS